MNNSVKRSAPLYKVNMEMSFKEDYQMGIHCEMKLRL